MCGRTPLWLARLVQGASSAVRYVGAFMGWRRCNGSRQMRKGRWCYVQRRKHEFGQAFLIQGAQLACWLGHCSAKGQEDGGSQSCQHMPSHAHRGGGLEPDRLPTGAQRKVITGRSIMLGRLVVLCLRWQPHAESIHRCAPWRRGRPGRFQYLRRHLCPRSCCLS